MLDLPPTPFTLIGQRRAHRVGVTRSSISRGRNLRPPWLLGPVSRKNSFSCDASLYSNPTDLSLNPISSESDENGIQTQMFKMAYCARITILRDESSRIVARFVRYRSFLYPILVPGTYLNISLSRYPADRSVHSACLLYTSPSPRDRG